MKDVDFGRDLSSQEVRVEDMIVKTEGLRYTKV